MRITICALILGLRALGFCFSQEQGDAWKGTARLNPADLFINLHNALPGVYATWTPYVLPKLGVPAEIDVNFGWGVLPGVEVSFLTGAEYLPAGPEGKDQNGLFLDAKIGLSLFFHEGTKAAFIGKANVGYQFITGKGLVFLPGAGIVYNGRSGLGLNVLLDLGFAYGRRKK
ncbi:MAG: hypothetical protein LBK63_06530 [Treponema sp.]|jgi:hypothetical protein|nr:hypothetical protein [Treponema sp.]